MTLAGRSVTLAQKSLIDPLEWRYMGRSREKRMSEPAMQSDGAGVGCVVGVAVGVWHALGLLEAFSENII